ncbi:MAG: peptidylprolyl isomerase [Pirellulales bacterium]|nr:peptidylprolyl isomerase [Pirellulales bacterium]
MQTLLSPLRRDWIIVVLLVLAAGSAGCRPGKQNNDAKPNDQGAASQPAPSADANDMPPSRRFETEKHPRLKIETSLGDMVVELDAENALLTVNNFLDHADDGFYDGTIFHEVNRGYAIMGGSHAEDLSVKPARLSVRNEADNGLKNVRGAVAMARDPGTIDSATSVFFINLTDNPHLDHRDATPEGYGYCVFGKVVEGMDVADRIGEVDTRETTAKDGSPLPRAPAEPVVIRSIRRVR